MEIYSPLKAAWHTADIEALRSGRGIVPHQLYLVIADLCNQACSFCSYRSPDGWGSEAFGEKAPGGGVDMNPNRMIPLRKCIEILTDAKQLGVRAIQFTGGGEPTVHPEHNQVFAHAQGLGLETALITNGTRLPQPEVLARMTWIRVSVDAGEEETYARTRKSRLWPKVMENLRALARIDGPMLGASFVVTRENHREIGLFCRRMRALGVPYVKLSAALTTAGAAYYDGILDEIMAAIAEAKAASERPGFRIVEVFSRRLEDLRIGRPAQPFCAQQRFAGYIGGDQKVYRCCNTAYTRHGLIGDLREQSYAAWLAGYSFDGFDARSCRHCQFHEKNEAVAYLVQPAPQHVEFV